MLHKALDIPLYERATQSIAHGALTNSKRPESFVKGVYPTHLKRGQGCYVWDTKGNRYIDFIAGLGSNLLGYGCEEITEAVCKQIRLGSVLSLGTELEVQCAERVKEVFQVDRVRFLKTGTEGCSAAIRIARAFTGRNMIFSEGYHGWSDLFTSLTSPSKGVVPLRTGLQISRLADLSPSAILDHIAAIIIEPVMTDISPRRIAYLHELRERCTKSGTLLIFDEVITGCRYPEMSVSKSHGIQPDIIVLGKALGGGLPIAVVGGKSEVMESDYFVSSTFAGDTLALASTLKTLDLLQTKKYSLDHLWEKGGSFMNQFNTMGDGIVGLEGYATRSILTGTSEAKALFMQECCKAGILMGPSLFFTFPHMEVLDEVLSIFSDIFRKLRTGSVKLEGEMPQTPFAAKVRQT